MARKLDSIRILVIATPEQQAALAALDTLGLTLTAAPDTRDLPLADLVERFDLLVVDLDLPNRFDILEEAIGLRPDLPVVAIGGRPQNGWTLEHWLTRAELRGAALALPKPLDADELVLACVQTLARRRSSAPIVAALAAELELAIAG